MDYFQENREILGEHPIFHEDVMQRKVKEMSLNDAHKDLRNVRTYISKERRNLENARTAKGKQRIEAKIGEYQQYLKLIIKRIESGK